MIILRKRCRRAYNHSPMRLVGLDITEKRADWFTIRSSNEGGSKKAMNAVSDRSSNFRNVGAAWSSISTLSTSESSCLSRCFKTVGRCRLIFKQSTHQIAASLSYSATSIVAKCRATYGENVQSSKRVGRPWCCARDIQFQNESPKAASRCAYFRKFRSNACSRLSYCPPKRIKVVCGSTLAFEAPRNAKGERNLFRALCQEPSYSSDWSSSQRATRMSFDSDGMRSFTR